MDYLRKYLKQTNNLSCQALLAQESELGQEYSIVGHV